jgi:hypothetical protein
VISISLDSPEDRPAIQQFLKKAKPSFQVLHDTKEAAKKAFRIEGLPMNVALDASGKIVAIASEESQLDGAVAAIAKGAKAARASR